MTTCATMEQRKTYVWWFYIYLLSGTNLACADLVVSDTFDFIVVGGGSAGSVLTNRLSGDGKYKVGLLEKGGEPGMLSEIPGLLPLVYYTDNADRYLMEEQEGVGLGLKDRRIPWNRGKGLGGGSLINYMIYTRGHKEDFDRWAAAGNPGWSYEDVLPFYKKLEHARLQNVNTSFRGTEGEVDAVHPAGRSEAVKAFMEACQEIGMPIMDDYLNGEPKGVGYVQVNTRDGRRCHAEKAFLHDIRDRKNLKIITGALVTKVVVDPVTKTARGVLYVKDGSTFYVTARKEVILSAGAYNSPQILMLSGIGPCKHLQEMGIEVVQDLQVGRTIYDHLAFAGFIFKTNQSLGPSYHDVVNSKTVRSFWQDGEGPLTVPAGVEALGFIQTPVAGEEISYSDVELVFMSATYNFDYGLFMRNEWGISDEAYEAVWRPLDGANAYSIFQMPFRPLSKGHMELRSVHPGEQPKFYGNYFTDPEGKDMKTMLSAIRMSQEIVAAPAFAKYGAEVVMTPFPGCEGHVKDSDEFWECQVRHLSTSVWHQVGTCRMGPKDDPEAVVDNELRVYGIKNLRVADCSVSPRPISAHTNIPAMMIGEKAADIILKCHSD